MKVKAVCCQNCGADLEVDESIRFVTCNFCGSKLEIVHDSTTTHSRLLEEIGEKTDRMSEDLKVIRLQNELEQIDREWQAQREGMMTKNKDGSRSKPSVFASVFGAGVVMVAGLVWFAMMAGVSSAGGPSGFGMFGFVIIGIGVVILISGVSRAGRYQQAEAEMLSKRRKLQAKLDALK
ncbi:hypothetical protein [Haloferula sp. A504]|uniref:hypothetical protein n=1 Tax=Haloferula sp. A504 TaxID=3373601 RepID=UPI0031CA7AD6|nr:hypothetical protein [Verrucomicrobiaceae bacterium E54]